MLRKSLCILGASWLVVGCFALRGADPWGEASPGAPIAEADCATCHSDIEARHAAGPHGAKNIACGQCHRGGGHPDFEVAVNDATCGSCHLAEYQQNALSAHAETAVLVGAEISPQALRAQGFRAGERFVRRSGEAEDGRLCAACHYDQHALSLGSVRGAGFCESCHSGLVDHFELEAEGNRCIGCHVEQDTTLVGQTVTSHSFAVE